MALPRLIIGETFDHLWIEAGRSRDPSVQNAAAVVGPHMPAYVFAHNGLCTGIGDTPENRDRPRKYAVTEHAERGVIYKAAGGQGHVHGGTMVALWAACPDCARAIVLSGIGRLIRHGWWVDRTAELEPHWSDIVATGDEILAAGGVEVIRYDGPISTGGNPLRFGGREFCPW